MKIKDLIKHLQTLDQEKELVILATDPTGWDYGQVVDDTTIQLEEIYPNEDNGLDEYFDIDYNIDYDNDDEEGEVECYVIRVNC
jgi:hypothetical protein